ncbi:hypothetical protein RRG08_035934 [Elysia crispata]|uniref:Uncharacterized protein n=1 Tax=Elysia crispata TaxID=231223 RepID=A0AAE1A2M4_9GAST|nr:hypothetical protein RRG08_035934 [Elysia crispata]
MAPSGHSSGNLEVKLDQLNSVGLTDQYSGYDLPRLIDRLVSYSPSDTLYQSRTSYQVCPQWSVSVYVNSGQLGMQANESLACYSVSVHAITGVHVMKLELDVLGPVGQWATGPYIGQGERRVVATPPRTVLKLAATPATDRPTHCHPVRDSSLTRPAKPTDKLDSSDLLQIP